jgi:hypothetical protein
MQLVHVSPTAADLQSAERAVTARLRRKVAGASLQFWGGLLGGTLVGFALFALLKAEYPAHTRSNLSVTATIGILLLGTAIHYGSAALGRNMVARRLYAEGSKLLQPYTLEATSTGLHIKAADSSATIGWPQVEEVLVSDLHTLVFTSPMYAVVVPARAFVSIPQYQEFASLLSRLASRSEA